MKLNKYETIFRIYKNEYEFHFYFNKYYNVVLEIKNKFKKKIDYDWIII